MFPAYPNIIKFCHFHFIFSSRLKYKERLYLHRTLMSKVWFTKPKSLLAMQKYIPVIKIHNENIKCSASDQFYSCIPASSLVTGDNVSSDPVDTSSSSV